MTNHTQKFAAVFTATALTLRSAFAFGPFSTYDDNDRHEQSGTSIDKAKEEGSRPLTQADITQHKNTFQKENKSQEKGAEGLTHQPKSDDNSSKSNHPSKPLDQKKGAEGLVTRPKADDSTPTSGSAIVNNKSKADMKGAEALMQKNSTTKTIVTDPSQLKIETSKAGLHTTPIEKTATVSTRIPKEESVASPSIKADIVKVKGVEGVLPKSAPSKSDTVTTPASGSATTLAPADKPGSTPSTPASPATLEKPLDVPSAATVVTNPGPAKSITITPAPTAFTPGSTAISKPEMQVHLLNSPRETSTKADTYHTIKGDTFGNAGQTGMAKLTGKKFSELSPTAQSAVRAYYQDNKTVNPQAARIDNQLSKGTHDVHFEMLPITITKSATGFSANVMGSGPKVNESKSVVSAEAIKQMPTVSDKTKAMSAALNSDWRKGDKIVAPASLAGEYLVNSPRNASEMKKPQLFAEQMSVTTPLPQRIANPSGGFFTHQTETFERYDGPMSAYTPQASQAIKQYITENKLNDFQSVLADSTYGEQAMVQADLKTHVDENGDTYVEVVKVWQVLPSKIIADPTRIPSTPTLAAAGAAPAATITSMVFSSVKTSDKVSDPDVHPAMWNSDYAPHLVVPSLLVSNGGLSIQAAQQAGVVVKPGIDSSHFNVTMSFHLMPPLAQAAVMSQIQFQPWLTPAQKTENQNMYAQLLKEGKNSSLRFTFDVGIKVHTDKPATFNFQNFVRFPYDSSLAGMK